MGREHRVVRLDDGVRDLRRRRDSERELRLAAVDDREALEEERAEARARAAARRVEAEEALEARAVVGELSHAVEHEVDDLLADGARRVLFARDDLLRVVELAVRARADLVAHGGLKVDVDGARDVLARARLREEGVERVVAAADRLVRRHLAVRLWASQFVLDRAALIGKRTFEQLFGHNSPGYLVLLFSLLHSDL